MVTSEGAGAVMALVGRAKRTKICISGEEELIGEGLIGDEEVSGTDGGRGLGGRRGGVRRCSEARFQSLMVEESWVLMLSGAAEEEPALETIQGWPRAAWAVRRR